MEKRASARAGSWLRVSAVCVDALDDSQRRRAFTQAGPRRPAQAEVVEKFRHFQPPRIVAARELEDRCLGRSHLRQHLVKCELLDTVAAAESFDVELSRAPRARDDHAGSMRAMATTCQPNAESCKLKRNRDRKTHIARRAAIDALLVRPARTSSARRAPRAITVSR